MTQGVWLAALTAGVFAALGVTPARAQDPWIYGGEVAGGMLLSEPQKSLFGPGASAAGSAYRSLVPKWLAGGRLRLGMFTDGKTPVASRANPDMGGLASAMLALRMRPLAKKTSSTRALARLSGLWVEAAAGGGLTGSLLRPMAELGVGYGMGFRGAAVSPALRYLHIVQPGKGRDGQDGMAVFVGVELLWGSDMVAPVAPVAAAVAAEPAAAPPVDQDGDGVPDAVDRCPTEKEDRDGFEDADGCPDLDNDRDGIPDDKDACPLQAEVINGIDDQDGCPDQGVITMVDDRVVLAEHVLFETDRARVSSQGRTALVAVMRLWSQHPEWERLDVEGHADERGSDQYNQWLSEERAGRVRKVMVELGLPGDKIVSRGFGKTRPRVQGRDDESLRLNRRVELVVVRKRAPAGPPAAPGATGVTPPGPLAPPPHHLSPPPPETPGFAPSLPAAAPTRREPAAGHGTQPAPAPRPARPRREPAHTSPDDERR